MSRSPSAASSRVLNSSVVRLSVVLIKARTICRISLSSDDDGADGRSGRLVGGSGPVFCSTLVGAGRAAGAACSGWQTAGDAESELVFLSTLVTLGRTGRAAVVGSLATVSAGIVNCGAGLHSRALPGDTDFVFMGAIGRRFLGWVRDIKVEVRRPDGPPSNPRSGH